MVQIDLQAMSAQQLQSYDQMTIEVSLKVKDISKLAVSLWQEVLKELNARNLVSLVSGTFDHVGDALIVRNYTSQQP
jgi:hypothetical protein